MPTYQYRCEKCGEVFERVEHITEHDLPHRGPKCGSDSVQHAPTT
ncbi:MAG: zinc ribbon domain-containing protein, partial [Burkholderiaceae bacterium]|nr:zinc ribbon domain-containing protein [Burkholderiaceae bacterium]